MDKLKHIWNNLRSKFWFLPSMIVLFSIVFAGVLVETDSAASDRWLFQWPRLFGTGAEGARQMMATIAGSMISVLGVTFSMILVVLALASSQYTSRILRNFIRSRVTQVILGIFAGIFAYSLIVMKTIRSGSEGAFVPNLAVFFGFVLALIGVGTLMFFIHHIAYSIQASSIIASVADETEQSIEILFPEELGQEPGEDEDAETLQTLAERNGYAVLAQKSGYIQSVNSEALLFAARENKAVIRMEHGIGEFVVKNTALVSIALEGPPDKETIEFLHGTFSIDRHRTVEQDVAFGIRQIVDVALKALSPGVIATTTAIMCVDYLTVIMARVATRQIPSSHRYEEGKLRVITKGPNFESLLSESFDQIRRIAKGDVVIMSRMLDAFQTLANLTARPNRRRALCEQVQWIAELAERTIESAHDRARIDTQLVFVREALESKLPVKD